MQDLRAVSFWSFAWNEFKTKLAFTLLALLAFRLAANMPLPLLANHQNTLAAASIMQQYNILSIGMYSWSTSFVLVGTLSIMPILKGLVLRKAEMDACPFVKLVITLAFGIALYTSCLIVYGVSQYLSPDFAWSPFSFVVPIATLLGGLALVLFLATVIDEYGVGQGFWLLVAVGILSDIVRPFHRSWIQIAIMHIPLSAVAACAVFNVAAIVMVDFVVRMWAQKKSNGIESLLFVALAGASSSGFLLSALEYMLSPTHLSELLSQDWDFNLITSTVVFCVLSAIFSWRDRTTLVITLTAALLFAATWTFAGFKGFDWFYLSLSELVVFCSIARWTQDAIVSARIRYRTLTAFKR